MRKFTVLLLMAVATLCSLQLNAQFKTGDDIDPNKLRSNAYYYLPNGYHRLSETSSIYYSIDYRRLSGPMYQYGISIIGEINGRYYSSTFGNTRYDDGTGSGFLGALQVNGGEAKYLNALSGTELDGVTMTARLEAQGDMAAKIVYTLTNGTDAAVTINAGVYADIMIGSNDEAPISRLNKNGVTYGLQLKSGSGSNAAVMCALFGEGVPGITPADDHWFGFFSSNWHENEVCGAYSSTIYDTSVEYPASNSQYYLVENGNYDSGMGFCWKNREIPAGESIELSYIISVGDYDIDEPVVPDPDEPGQDIFTYEVEAYNFDGWNDLTVAHPAHIWGEYEHPYGFPGYIEYRVDGPRAAGEWTRIETPLVSGEEFDLPFDMFFNPEVADIHTLELRFTLDLGSYTELDGLEWEDVRSMSLTVDPDVQAYDGTPKTFVVTVGGVIDYTLGENGEYINPGDYSFSIEGVYEYNTIGINTVDFSVDKGQSVVDVQMPEAAIEFDNQPHGANVTLVTGDGNLTVTYLNTVTGQTSSEAPTAVGVYIVLVEVSETDFYYGIAPTPYGPFEIYAEETGIEELNINSEDNGAWYTIDGRRVAAPIERGIYIHNGKKYIVK